MPVIPLNDLRRGYDADAPDIRRAVQDVLEGGWYVHGPQHDAFERELADYVGVDHALGVGSGTDALELALTALAENSRNVIVTAANAGGYTSVAARRSGLGLRFADVDPETLCLDPGDLEHLLDEDVAAVVVTHLYGRLADVDQLTKICAAAGVPLVEDCAQAMGATSDGRRAGSFGTVATFSFYPTKNLGALGDGGAVVTGDTALADELRALRQYGWSRKYVIDLPGGRNSRLDELQAAVLRVRLPRVDAGNARRRTIVTRYAQAGARTLRVLPADGAQHVGHLAVVLCDDRAAAQAAFARADISTDVHYPVPDHQQPALVDQRDGRSLPVTEEISARVLTLPCFPELTDDEIDEVCSVLASL